MQYNLNGDSGINYCREFYFRICNYEGILREIPVPGCPGKYTLSCYRQKALGCDGFIMHRQYLYSILC